MDTVIGLIDIYPDRKEAESTYDGRESVVSFYDHIFMEEYDRLMQRLITQIKDAMNAAGNAQDTANTAISSVNDVRASFTEYQDSVATEFEATVQYVDGRTETLNAWIRQGLDGTTPYLELGKSGSELKARLTNTSLGFYQGDKCLADFGGEKAHMPDAEIDRAKVGQLTEGSYTWIDNSDEHLTLVYTG